MATDKDPQDPFNNCASLTKYMATRAAWKPYIGMGCISLFHQGFLEPFHEYTLREIYPASKV